MILFGYIVLLFNKLVINFLCLEDGASEDGFMNTECMNVLLQDWSKSERDEHQGLFETYTFTPIVGSCQTKKNAVDVFDICRRRGPLFDPIMFDCKYMVRAIM